MKKNTVQTGDIVLVAAAAGAVAAGAVIAVYELLKSEKGQAGIAKAKSATVAAAGKVKETATVAAGKVKATAVNAATAVKAKLPKKDVACECECECECNAEECVEAPVEA